MWQIRAGDSAVIVDDLPIREIAKIAERHDGSWLDLLRFPGRTPAAMYDLVVLAYGQIGADPPPAPVSAADARKVLELFEPIADDLPTEFEQSDDGPTVPLEEGQEIPG